MQFLYTPSSHFNLANLFTFVNITAGLSATYFITQNNFFLAIAPNISKTPESDVLQLDSFADFLSFVLVPVFLIFQAVYSTSLSGVLLIFGAIASIYYVIAGLRRLIHFNIHTDAGSVDKYFTGVPTPLGAILLWLVYLSHAYEILPALVVITLMALIGWSLNSTIKVRHP